MSVDVPGRLRRCRCLPFVLFMCRPCVIDCHVVDGDLAPGSCVKRGEGSCGRRSLTHRDMACFLCEHGKGRGITHLDQSGQ